MTQDERRLYLIKRLSEENSHYSFEGLPTDSNLQWLLLRSLMNVRPPLPIDEEFLRVQDEYLQELISEAGIVDADMLPPSPSDGGLALW
jgi:hypothetical protein